jgi:hypothetical protein
VQYHLKITNDLDNIKGPQRWRTVHDVLEKRYRAPKLIQWIDFSEIGFAGLLFEHLDGRVANFSGNRALVELLIKLADHLHKDEEIRSYFKTFGSGKTYLDHFVETYIDRFTADLEIVAAGELPFISASLLTWMQKETDRLRETASRLRSFHNPAIAQ